MAGKILTEETIINVNDSNILYVALGEDNEYLYSDSCIVEDINWIINNEIKQEEKNLLCNNL